MGHVLLQLNGSILLSEKLNYKQMIFSGLYNAILKILTQIYLKIKTFSSIINEDIFLISQ